MQVKNEFVKFYKECGGVLDPKDIGDLKEHLYRRKRLYAMLGIPAFSFKGINASELIFKLDERGICVSSGSACSSENTNPSHVLTAMNVPEVYLNSAIRTTFGDNNTFEQVDYVVKILKQIIN